MPGIPYIQNGSYKVILPGGITVGIKELVEDLYRSSTLPQCVSKVNLSVFDKQSIKHHPYVKVECPNFQIYLELRRFLRHWTFSAKSKKMSGKMGKNNPPV